MTCRRALVGLVVVWALVIVAGGGPVHGEPVLVRTLRGHTWGVFAVAFSPDGRIVASGASDGTLKLWDVEAGQELRTLSEHASAAYAVAFSPDGRLLAAGLEDQTIRLWEVATGRHVRTFVGHTRWVSSVTLSPGGGLLASGAADDVVKLWDVNTGRELRTLVGHRGAVESVAFAPDGSIVASASDDRTVKLWDVNTGRELRTLTGHVRGVLSVAFSPDGSILASAGADDLVKLWDVATGRERRTLTGHKGEVSAVAFSPRGDVIVSSARWPDSTVRLWDVATGQELHVLTDHVNGANTGVNAVAFSPDGALLASAAMDYTVRLWELRPYRPDLTAAELIFDEDFSEPRAWSTTMTGDVFRYLADDVLLGPSYHYVSYRGGRTVWSYLPGQPELRDFILEFTVRSVSATPEHPETCSIIFRMNQDTRDYYQMNIVTDGSVAMYRMQEAASFTLLSRTYAESIARDREPSRVRLIVKGTELVIEINGVEVGYASDSMITEAGRIGIGVATSGDFPYAHMVYSALRLYRLPHVSYSAAP